MKRYIRSSKRIPNTVSGRIATTGEPCVMQVTGYWTGAGGRHITSYWRVDKPDLDDNGERVYRQYSMDRHHLFYLETEDVWEDYMQDWLDYLENSED